MLSSLPFPLLVSGLILIGFAAAFCALMVASGLFFRLGQKVDRPEENDLVFVFHQEVMIDSSAAGAEFLALTHPAKSDLLRVVDALARQFSGLGDAVGEIKTDVPKVLKSVSGKSELLISQTEDRLRISLVPSDINTEINHAESQVLKAAKDRLSESRNINALMPYPMWQETEDGEIIWANDAYKLLETLQGLRKSDEGASAKIFDVDAEIIRETAPKRRANLASPSDDTKQWFELEAKLLGKDRLITATPIDRIVRAERSLRDFVQTLTQTFAHLNVGLAIFGQDRELAIFNPALSELLELPPEFLVNRPSLFEVFDRLREHRMMQEPKDYNAWLSQISALEAAAADGTFSETWSLVDGRTYRVSGRPHPDGALAFLFEDISAEITQERGFRSDLQIAQSVINSLEEAIAVFTPAGQITICNQAFLSLWKFPDMDSLSELSFVELTRKWQLMCQPTPVWGDARDFAAILNERSNWTADVMTQKGKKLACRFDALPGGCTLVGFLDPDVGRLSNAPLQPLSVIG